MTDVSVDGHTLRLSNLDKALFPDGYSKGEMINYYVGIAPVMLGHLKGRPVTVRRYPNGTDTAGFVEKNMPRHAPDWIRSVEVPRKEKGPPTTRFVVVDDLPTLIWLVNLAAVEFHTPMWRFDGKDRPLPPDLVVFDLDPGSPATIAECCKVAILLRERMRRDRVELLAKTSGSKGLQLYGLVAPRRWEPPEINQRVHAVAEELEASHDDLVVSRMTKALRAGKVLIDWSQNNPSKTTVSAYSLRALSSPAVSTPVEWAEVEGCAESSDPSKLVFGPAEVAARVERQGDLFESLAG